MGRMTPRVAAAAIGVVLAATDAAAVETRTDQAVAAMMRGGLVKVSSARHRNLQGELERAVRFVLRHRLDCASFSEADYAPAASAAAGIPVFRVTCQVRGVPGGFANFFVRRDEIGKLPLKVRRDPE